GICHGYIHQVHLADQAVLAVFATAVCSWNPDGPFRSKTSTLFVALLPDRDFDLDLQCRNCSGGMFLVVKGVESCHCFAFRRNRIGIGSIGCGKKGNRHSFQRADWNRYVQRDMQGFDDSDHAGLDSQLSMVQSSLYPEQTVLRNVRHSWPGAVASKNSNFER